MFYICNNCNRRWEYPIAECPHCFEPLEAMVSRDVRVRNVIKVSIPTLSHPNVPYHILLLEDGAGNVWGHKSEKEYKVGDEFKVETNNSRSAVAIWRIKYDYAEALEKILELVGGINIDSGSKILILPTINKPSHSYFRDNTSPEFLAAVLKMLVARRAVADNITVAGQSFDEMPVAAMAQKSGLIAAGAAFGVRALDLAEAEFVHAGNFDISKKAVDADLIIDLAMESMGQANAAKNMFKVLRKESYLGQKYLSSDASIAVQLEPLLPQMIVIGEAEFVQRSNKLTTFLGLVLAGRSCCCVDRVFNEVAQSFKLPEIIKDVAIADIPVVGRTIKEVQYQAEIF